MHDGMLMHRISRKNRLSKNHSLNVVQTVLTTTLLHKINAPEPIDKKYGIIIDYVR